MIDEYPRADAVVLNAACRSPSYRASGMLPSYGYLHDLDYQHRNSGSVEVVMVDESHRRELIGSVLSSTAFCYPLCDEWKISTAFSGASAVAENRRNVFYAAQSLDGLQEMYVVNRVLGRDEMTMNVSLSSESAGLYSYDVGVLCVGFSRGGLQSENVCGEEKSSGCLSSLGILIDVDGLKGNRNPPLNDRPTRV